MEVSMQTQIDAQGASPATSPAITIVERMAATMQDMRAAGHIITADTLAVHGDFTDDEVRQHGDEAANLARARAVKRVG